MFATTPGMFNADIAPIPWALYAGELLQGAATLSANTAYFVGVTLNATATLTKIRMRFGTGGAGNYDIGIYDSSGKKLVTRGTTASGSGPQTFTLPTPLVLLPGNYWLAFWIDNATDTVSSVSIGDANVAPVRSLATSSPLAATTGAFTNSNVKVSIVGILSGEWV